MHSSELFWSKSRRRDKKSRDKKVATKKVATFVAKRKIWSEMFENKLETSIITVYAFQGFILKLNTWSRALAPSRHKKLFLDNYP